MGNVKTESKKNNKPLIITLSAIAAFLVVLIVVLSVVKVDARVAVDASEVNEIQVITTGSYDYDAGKDPSTVPLATEKEIADFLAELESASKHSVGYGILNGQWFASVKKTGEAFKPENCKSLAGSSATPLVVISFGDKQSAEVCGETVTYDLIVFNVRETENKLETYSFWLIDSSVVYEMDESNDEYVDYVAYEYKGVMNGSAMMDYVAELQA